MGTDAPELFNNLLHRAGPAQLTPFSQLVLLSLSTKGLQLHGVGYLELALIDLIQLCG